MKSTGFTLAMLSALSMTAQAKPTTKPTNHLDGDYVEARTASVFAGACHYNGELTTTGREAELVWHIREGVWNGQSLNGLSAIASVVSEANLQDETATRQSVLYLDAKATPAQAKALTEILKAKYARSLGKVVSVKTVPITFSRTNDLFRVKSEGVTSLQVEAMPNHECCKQPFLVWYKPMVTLQDRKVGYTKTSGISDKILGTAWEKNGENTAFYGRFAL